MSSSYPDNIHQRIHVSKVTLAGGTFKGFLCQARTNVADYASTVGTLAQTGAVTMNQNCGAGRALTHSENGDKNTAQFTWVPSADHGTVQIVCSFVQTKTTFWVKGSSAQLTYGGNCVATETTTPSSASQIVVSMGIFLMAFFIYFLK